MNDLGRRDFLRITGATAAAGLLPAPLLAQDTKAALAAKPVVVSIYLRGGQDALNVLVPFGDKRYKDIRPTIGILAKDTEDAKGVIALDDTFGLHPSMKSLKPLYDSKRFAPLVCAGSPHNTRSHFDAQDFMEYAAPGLRTVKAGWLNRFLMATKPKKTEGVVLRALAMQGLLPRALRGECPALAVPERNVLDNSKVLDTFEDIYGGGMGGMDEKRDDDPVVNAGRDTLETLKRYKEIESKGKARKTSYPGGRLGTKLKDIASVIHADAGLEVACVDIGGWDHHANEGDDVGTIATMLKDVSDSLAAFAEDLDKRLDQTLVVVMTEFGRTCKENGNNGTDHGHGGAMMLLGGAVKGGKVHGDWRGLDDKALYEGRDLPVTTDFRDVFADVLRNHLKFDPPKDFFPEYKAGSVKGLF
jgi:uncharacterized protein (DUF1501 family)